MVFAHNPDALAPAPKVLEPLPDNERLILSLVRENNGMSKAEIARATGLSAQSATNIVKRLEAEGLLRAGKSVRGKVGQPSKPYLINADGAMTIGVKVGRQSVEVATMGFDYQIIDHRSFGYDYPVYDTVRAHVLDTISDFIGALDAMQISRLLGIGLAIPDALSSWESAIGAPAGSMAPWDTADLRAEIESAFGLPVAQMNDASAACLAALKLGSARPRSFLYIYVGTFAGGGLALDGRVYEGLTGNASALGSMPMGVARGGPAEQLIAHASLQDLEDMAEVAGLSPTVYYDDAPLSAEADQILQSWIAKAAPALAFTFVAGQAFLDLEVMVLDSSLADPLRARLVEATVTALSAYDTRGLRPFAVQSGEGGVRARSLGSALLPFQAVTEFDLM
ncbi:ROK family protein [Pseudooceanicola sp. MF1-13]|uniref:ROK family transcriptional regulator n=1 Tax=Pseudooceanicola sp. MF1-13 TaxID=3379095 RepID=UPI003891323A